MSLEDIRRPAQRRPWTDSLVAPDVEDRETPTIRQRKKHKVEAQAVMWQGEERWDYRRLQHINELIMPLANCQLVSDVLQDFTPTIKNPNPPPFRCVRYSYGDDYTWGRIYGRGLQSCPGWIRRICSHAYYHDLDFVNCGPTILCQVLTAALGEVAPIISRYAYDREGMIEQLRQDVPLLTHVPKDPIKKLLLSIAHNADHTTHLWTVGISLEHPPIALLVELQKELRKAGKKLKKHKDYREIFKDVEDNKHKHNKMGTFMSRVWQQKEVDAIMWLVDFLKQHKTQTDVLCHDGVQVLRKIPNSTADFPQDILRLAEAHIATKTGITLRLCEKSMVPTKEDWAKYWGEKSLNRIKGGLEMQQVYLLSRDGQLNKFKRRNGYVMAPHPVIPGVYMQHQEAEVYINCVLQEFCHMAKNVMWFKTVDHPQFKLLTESCMSQHVISFIDGYWDIDTLLFHYWDPEVEPPQTDHYYETNFMAQLDRPSPLWDKLLSFQLEHRSSCSVCQKVAPYLQGETLFCGVHLDPELEYVAAPTTNTDLLEILIGRLFYDVGKHDNWQVFPYLKGDGDTGKSTICDVIRSMFAVGKVGVVGRETTFGLEAIYNKRLMLIPDCPAKLSAQISQTDFQSIVSGEPVSVARKNALAVADKKWTAPLLAAGNYYPDYNDNGGSVSRRIVPFLFEKLITDRCTTLKDDILANELVSVIIRCIYSYRSKVESSLGADFWTKVAPEGVRLAQESVRQETNYLACFLGNGNSHYQVLKDETATTRFSELERAFVNYMRFTHPNVPCPRLDRDKHPIKAAGFGIDKQNLCKTCHATANKQNCGDHYNSANRYKALMITNMRIVTLDTQQKKDIQQRQYAPMFNMDT
jgi:hypothetical protein